MRNAVGALLVGVIAACTGGGPVSTVSPSPLTSSQLAARPLHLPTVDGEQFCPISRVTFLGGTAPRLGAPLEFGFGVRPDGSPWPTGNYALNKTVWEFSGPQPLPTVLLRGARIDGPGELYFGGNGIQGSGARVIDAEGTMNFYSQLSLPGGSAGSFYTYPTKAGCYAIQADSDTFSEVVVFKAV
jgi:hypothetical protein